MVARGHPVCTLTPKMSTGWMMYSSQQDNLPWCVMAIHLYVRYNSVWATQPSSQDSYPPPCCTQSGRPWDMLPKPTVSCIVNLTAYHCTIILLVLSLWYTWMMILFIVLLRPWWARGGCVYIISCTYTQSRHNHSGHPSCMWVTMNILLHGNAVVILKNRALSYPTGSLVWY